MRNIIIIIDQEEEEKDNYHVVDNLQEHTMKELVASCMRECQKEFMNIENDVVLSA